MGDSLEIVHDCALRFDGQLYLDTAYPTGEKDFTQLTNAYVETLLVLENDDDNFATFYALQRFLCKWGGEMLSIESPDWTAYLLLFLHLYRRPCPPVFASRQFGHKWEARTSKDIESAAAAIRSLFRSRYGNHLESISAWSWAQLGHMQLGRYAEYYVKMELTRFGFEVFSPEVDDRGIDFIARKQGRFLSFQVKSSRNFNYVFMRKDRFEIAPDIFAAIVLFFDGQPPKVYFIPAIAWKEPKKRLSELLVSRDYVGKKSPPEWGINLSAKNMPLMKGYSNLLGLTLVPSTSKSGDQEI